MSRASEAYERLSLAMIDTKPNCLNMSLFTADDLDKDEIAECAAICETCPLFSLCSAYAELERPKAGVWAGKKYRTNQTRKGTQ